MTIYIDIFFLVNLVLDFLVLWLVSVLDRRKTKIFILFKGAFIGSLVLCIAFLFEMTEQKYLIIFGIMSLFLSLKVSFKVKGTKVYSRLMALSLLTSFIVGGLFISIFYISNAGYITVLSIGSINVMTLLLLTVVFYILAKLWSGTMISSISPKGCYCRIKVYLQNKEAEIIAFQDTGNFLIYDNCGKKIILSEFCAVKNLFPEEDQILYLKKMKPQDIIELFSESVRKRAKLILFSSLGKKVDSLTAVRLDKACIYTEKEKTLNDVILVIYNEPIFAKEGCNGIINPIIIEE